MFSGHERIVFSLFESNIDWNMASVKVNLAIKVPNCKNGALFVAIFNESPILSRLKPNRFYLPD